MDAHEHGPGAGPECALCPVCVLLQALTTARPDVTGHVLAAGPELTLALRAALDAQVEAYDATTARAAGAATATAPRRQRIPVD
ncbi:MAG: hypothetical protein M3O86_01085 [Actinomycetota bacterium]|nr:hypothetical protein [Actinomycetota bacterium]